ncbi:MAG: GNAT family N-acetyltransferase [Pseudomonadota bacterium]
MTSIGLTKRADIPGMQTVLDQTGLFPSDLLPDMISPGLEGEAIGDRWLTCETDGQIAGFCFARAEELAEGTWNMLAIAVLPILQGRGCGGALVRRLEDDLRASGQRVLIADTSGTEEFAQTRAFYRNNGYAEEARIRDFWAAGDDKIVFWKSLTQGS